MRLLHTEHPTASPNYLQLKARACRALAAGELPKADKLFAWALVEARRIGDRGLQELAFCDVAAMAIEMGRADGYLGPLQDILETSSEPSSRFLAAYNTSAAFLYKKNTGKARFYAALAHDNAGRMDSPYELAVSLYKLATLWLIEGHPQTAHRCLEDCVQLGTECLPPNSLALTRSVLGYCISRLGQGTRALALLQASVDELVSTECKLYEEPARLNLGFTLLEAGDFEAAIQQAELLLEAGCRDDYRKNALYLAGEAYSCQDRPELAREYLALLQSEYYPDFPGILDLLPVGRTHRLVNWFS